MRGAERFARRLKAIGRADDFRQSVVAKGDVLINICAGDGLSVSCSRKLATPAGP